MYKTPWKLPKQFPLTNNYYEISQMKHILRRVLVLEQFRISLKSRCPKYESRNYQEITLLNISVTNRTTFF